MKYVIAIAVCLFSAASLWSQNCDITAGLSDIQKEYEQGRFDKVLDRSEELLECPEQTDQQHVALLIWKYKVLRNTRKTRKGHITILQAVSFLEEKGIPKGFDFEFLLAESYALRRDLPNYKLHVQRIKDSLEPLADQPSVDLGRYYLIEYYAFDKGDPSGAAAMGQKALSVLEKLEDPPVYYLGNVLRGLGNMNRTNGDFDRANLYYQQELELYEKSYHEGHFDIAVCHYNIGNVYYEKLEYQSALDHYLQAHDTWSKVFEPRNVYMRNLNEAIGDMYWELGDKENALTYIGYSIADESAINNDKSEKTVSIADSLWDKGNYANALQFYEEAYKWREKTYGKNHMWTGACKNFVARAIRSAGDISASLIAYQEAIDILVEEMDSTSIYENPTATMTFRSHQYLLESLIGKGELFTELFAETGDLKDLETALETQEVAIRVLERMKHGHMSETSKLFWSGRTLSLIENSIATAVQLYEETNDPGYLEKAFEFSERSKYLLLLTSLNDSENTAFANVPEEVLLQEQELRKSITEYMGRLENEEKRCGQVRPKLLDLYKAKIISLQKDYDLMISRLKHDYPEYYHLKYEAPVAGVADLRSRLLDPQTAIVSYFSGDSNTYVFLLVDNDISVRRIDNTEVLTQDVASLFNTVRSRSTFQQDPQSGYRDYTRKALHLYNVLLAPELDAKTELKRLILIPDGTLSYLPFEALLTQEPESDSRNYSTLPYLIQDYAISYSPSASIKLVMDDASPTNNDYVGFAPDYSEESDTELRKKPANLEFSTPEVNFAAELFGGKSWTGDQVTEDLLKNNTARAGILHLAMHGDVEDDHPLLSKLYFNSSGDDDGILHTYEIYNMKIPAQLVILSACNTARGRLERGEGILSLERAFQYAGSKSLLSTLWTVDDGSSARLTQFFLENLKEGQMKDVALQNAKLRFLESSPPETLPPFYWSSFKLTGNTAALSKSSPIKYWLGGGIVAVFLLFIYVRLRQTRKAA